MKRMFILGITMLFTVPAVMAAPNGLNLGENNVIVQKAIKVATYEVKSARMTEPVDSIGGMKASTLELVLTVEGNVCPSKASDITFFLNSTDPTNFRGPSTLELLSYYKYPVDYGCALYSHRADVTVKIEIGAADFEEYDWTITVPLGFDGRDGVKKAVVSVKPQFKFSVQLI